MKMFFVPSGCMPAGSGFFCCDPLRCSSSTLVCPFFTPPHSSELFSPRDSHLPLTLPETEPRPQCSPDFVSLHPVARTCTCTSGGVCVNTIVPGETTALLCLQSLVRHSHSTRAHCVRDVLILSEISSVTLSLCTVRFF